MKRIGPKRVVGMVMRHLLAVAFAAQVAVASAQTPAIPGAEPAPSAFGPDPVIQITTTFRTRIEGVTDQRDIPSPTAQDAARRTLYYMAANECRVLAEYWKAECRLSTMYVSLANPEASEVQPQVPSMFGTAVYELKPTVAR
jgi:hypothetical protein